MGYIKIIALVLLITAAAAAGYAVVSTYNGAITDAKRLEGENKSLTSSLTEAISERDRLAQRAKFVDTILADRRKAGDTQASLERKFDDAVQKILAGNKDAADWWAGSVPVGLRSAGAAGDNKDGKGDAALKPAAGKPSP